MSLKKITENKRELSVETIASAIHADYLISSLKNKYIDPLFLYRRQLTKDKKKNRNETSNSDSFSLNKLLVHKYLITKQDEKKLEHNLNKNILPIISPLKYDNIKSNELMATSGMFKQKEYYKQNYQKLKLGNVMNFKNIDDSFYQYLYPKIENIKKINDKYNLNLDLKFMEEDKPKPKNNKRKSIAQKDLVNYLFNKYVFRRDKDSNKNNLENNNIFNRENDKQNIENKFRLKESEIKKKNSFSIDEILEKNSNIFFNINKISFKKESKDNEKSFITRLEIKKNNYDEPKDNSKTENKMLKNKKRIFSHLIDKNKNIINHDQKIFVDCLYSDIISNIDKNKIIYNPIGNVKTNFAITKESSYKKIKKFESEIDNIIKFQKDSTITINK